MSTELVFDGQTSEMELDPSTVSGFRIFLEKYLRKISNDNL